MSKWALIVGGVAGGASAATRLRRLDEGAEIVLFDRGPHVSLMLQYGYRARNLSAGYQTYAAMREAHLVK